MKLPPLMGIEVNWMIYRNDGEPLDPDEFWDAIAEFIESKEWSFGGSHKVVDLNDPDA